MAVSVLASIDGTVVNGTAGKPQPGVSITLVKPGAGGMQTLGTTVTDTAGHFRFENDQPGAGPQLLQVTYKGANYNKLMTPNLPTSGVELNVYESTKSPSVARIAQRMLLKVEEGFRRRGVRIARLEVRSVNTGAQDLYVKLGFAVTQRLPRYYSNGGDGLLMIKSLV